MRNRNNMFFGIAALVIGLSPLLGDAVRGLTSHWHRTAESSPQTAAPLTASEVPDRPFSAGAAGEVEAFALINGISPDAYPPSLVALLGRNPDAADFVLRYPLDKDNPFDTDLSDCLPCTEVPRLYQWDARWGYAEYCGDVMGLTGCGPTSLAMVSLYVLQDAANDPLTIAAMSEKRGYGTESGGSSWSLIAQGGTELGLSVKELPLSEGIIKRELAAGHPVICNVGEGDFTLAGHYIVLAGVYDDGTFRVNDPNSPTRSDMHWSYDVLSGQINNLWACGRP